MPWRRLRWISSRCCGNGSPLISTTLSSMRVKTRTTSRNSSQSNRAWSVKGSRTNLVRLIEPKRQAPYGGRPCSQPARRQGLVHLAGHLAEVVGDVALGHRPVAPQDARFGVFVFVAADREQQVPGAVLFHRLHEFVGDQARQVELAQPPVLALGLDEVH